MVKINDQGKISRRAGGTLTGLLFPKRCPVCRDIISEEKLICSECADAFEYVHAPVCGKCGKQLYTAAGMTAGDGFAGEIDEFCTAPGETCCAGSEEDSAAYGRTEATVRLCSDCSRFTRLFESGRSLMLYDEVSEKIMIDIKYNNGKEFIDFFSDALCRRYGGWIREIRPAALIPVPVHKKRLKMRGYNQAQLLAEGIGKRLNIPVRSDILVRNKNTAAQKGLGAGERLANLQNAFSCSGSFKKNGIAGGTGPTLLLIDDIYTTGSTMEACTEALLDAGAGRVYVLSVCSGMDQPD